MRMRSLTLLVPVLVSTLFLGAQTGYAQPRASGPTLTVIGFGLVNLRSSGAASSPQLVLNLQTVAPTATAALAALTRDIAGIEKALKAVGVSSAEISIQGPPGLNYVSSVSQASCEKAYKLKGIPGKCTAPGFQTNESVQVTIGTLTRLAAVLTKSGVAKAPGVQNFYINQSGQNPGAATPAALTSGYAQAFRDARTTATLLARADQLSLGSLVSVTEGALLSTPCGGMGCSPTPVEGVNPPQPGPNQELVAVTVTYRTSR